PPRWVVVLLILATVLVASAVPGHTQRGGRHGGGGHGWHGGHRGGGHGWHGGHGWWGPRVTIGVGPYWGASWWPYAYPYSYPYSYPYGYPSAYPPQVSVAPAQPPAAPPVWYYCDDAAGYYPYVQHCPGGWRTVTPSPP
ncbi:MAG TPA: hypothetical protein VI542_04160, partial [Candidatus Tectomicrobia bacterium]